MHLNHLDLNQLLALLIEPVGFHRLVWMADLVFQMTKITLCPILQLKGNALICLPNVSSDLVPECMSCFLKHGWDWKFHVFYKLDKISRRQSQVDDGTYFLSQTVLWHFQLLIDKGICRSSHGQQDTLAEASCLILSSKGKSARSPLCCLTLLLILAMTVRGSGGELSSPLRLWCTIRIMICLDFEHCAELHILLHRSAPPKCPLEDLDMEKYEFVWQSSLS